MIGYNLSTKQTPKDGVTVKKVRVLPLESWGMCSTAICINILGCMNRFSFFFPFPVPDWLHLVGESKQVTFSFFVCVYFVYQF